MNSTGMRSRFTAAAAAATLAIGGILLAPPAQAATDGTTVTFTYRSSLGLGFVSQTWSPTDNGCRNAVGIDPSRPASLTIENGLNRALRVFAGNDCSGQVLAKVAGNNPAAVTVKVAGNFSVRPMPGVLTTSGVLQRMNTVAPLDPMVTLDNASGTGIDAYANTATATADAIGRGERSTSQNADIDKALGGLAPSPGTATYQGKRYMLKKSGYDWDIAVTLGGNYLTMEDACKAVECKFVGVRLANNPAFTNSKYADYPTLFTSATTTAQVIKQTETTTITRTDTVTTGFKIGVSAAAGYTPKAPGGSASVTPTFEYNYSRALSDATAGTTTLEADYNNPSGAYVYVQARANVGWYSGYMLIPTNKVPTGYAIPIRMKVQSTKNPSPATWNAVHVPK
ncbi:ETX/MTX2 family pore-forming toxin [Streptomyces sp. NPDC006283]|uniref:ETX/MTX2 family pore-forming toxin n=1 Tax=Streptomyces sp. NPDC006283 TaxID=3156741 RepID=UPI0033BB45E6